MERVTVIVATFGGIEWEQAGDACEYRHHFLRHDDRCSLRVIHGDTLARARNAGAWNADTEWLCFLDADDDLEPGYLDALLAGSGDLRAPQLRLGGGLVDLVNRHMDTMNPCCIGTLIRRDMFLDAGGFWHERAWEDWSVFRRAWLLGAEVVHHRDAVYRAGVRPESRNNTVERPQELHRDIRSAHAAWLACR